MTRHEGFSLVEVIVVIILVALLGALVAKILGGRSAQAPQEIAWSRDEGDIEKTMETIIADYVRLVNDESTRDSALTTIIGRDYGDGVTFTATSFPRTGGSEGGGATTLYKVSIKRAGHTLTTLLTPSRNSSEDDKVNF